MNSALAKRKKNFFKMSSFISPSRFLSFQYNIYKEKKCIVEKTPPPQKKTKHMAIGMEKTDLISYNWVAT